MAGNGGNAPIIIKRVQGGGGGGDGSGRGAGGQGGIGHAASVQSRPPPRLLRRSIRRPGRLL